MPKRTDIQSVLVIGSGPIVIGQAAEFDYSGTQACRVLKAEGLRVILVNSNPATIMTDPEIADATYVEPITPEFVEKIIAKERPDALLPTLGGQTALNTAISMHEQGVLEKYGVELIGANVEAINKGEDRDLFKGVVEAVTQEDRARRVRPLGDLPLHGRRPPGCRRARRLPRRRPPLLHHGRRRLRLRARRGGAAPHRRPGPDALPDHRGAPGGVDPRLEGVRAGADARQARQRGGRLLHRELRPDGRAHRRLDHRRPGDDADRPGVPDPAGRRHRDHPRGRRRHRRLQHPVRGQPRRRPDHRHRDEPARLPLLRARLQGDRLPDRQDRRPARGGLHAGRDPQRHHREDPGLLRADPRLRRRQGAAVRLREVPGRRRHAHHDHEVGRRGHGHRPQLPRGAQQGAALAGEEGQPVRLRRRAR